MSHSSQNQDYPRFLHYRKRQLGFPDFFVIFETKPDQHKIEGKKTIKLYSLDHHLAPPYVFKAISSLFFDKKDEFLHFCRFDKQLLPLDVLCIATSSILDNFTAKSTWRRYNDITDPVPCRPRRNLFKRDFWSSEKLPRDWVATIAESHSSTVKRYHLIQIIIRQRAGTHNLVLSDQVWQDAECTCVWDSTDSNSCDTRDRSACSAWQAQIGFLSPKKVFDNRQPHSTIFPIILSGNSSTHQYRPEGERLWRNPHAYPEKNPWQKNASSCSQPPTPCFFEYIAISVTASY